MLRSFFKFAPERRFVRGLRARSLERSCLEALVTILHSHEQRRALPRGLLWNMYVRAEKALARLAPDDPRYPLVKDIRHGALWEVQYRQIRGE